MKQTIQVEQAVCDLCGSKDMVYTACLGCGIDLCYECKKTRAKEYTHGVNVSGSGDGTYCNPCDDRLRRDRNPLHSAYVAIQSLKDEARGFWERFEQRKVEAETTLRRAQQQLGKTEGNK